MSKLRGWVLAFFCAADESSEPRKPVTTMASSWLPAAASCAWAMVGSATALTARARTETPSPLEILVRSVTVHSPLTHRLCKKAPVPNPLSGRRSGVWPDLVLLGGGNRSLRRTAGRRHTYTHNMRSSALWHECHAIRMRRRQ